MGDVRQRAIRNLLIAATGLTVQLVGGPPASAQSGPAGKYELHCVGSDEFLWIAVGEWVARDKGAYENWLAWYEKTSSDSRAVPGPLEQSGGLARLALAGRSLHGFYADGTHFRYSPGAVRERRLPEAPEAVAGEDTRGASRIWAVVSARAADAIAAEYARTLRFRSTQPAVPPAEPASEPQHLPDLSARPEDGYHLISYDGYAWRPEFAAPVDASSERIWLAVAGGRIHLFWQHTRDDSEIRYVWREDDQWSTGPALRLAAPPADAFVGVGNRRLVFTAMVPERARPQQWRPFVFNRPERPPAEGDSGWAPSPELKLADGQPLLLPARSVAGVFGHQVAIVRRGAQRAEIAFWRLTGGKPDLDFAEVRLRRSVIEPGERGHRDLRIALVLGALFLLVFWRRHNTFAVPVTLPAGSALAGAGRRAVAAALDLAPAALFVAWWWAADLRAALDEMAATGDPAQLEAAGASVIFWPSIVFRGIYIAYCAGFELVWSRTPGKWLMGCTVLSETGAAPNRIQILIRNVTRLVEFQPDPPIFLPLLLLVFVTRNRQRVGDLLAHTVVVEPAPVLEGPGEDDRS